MKNSNAKGYRGQLIIIAIAILAFASLPLLSKARTTATSINIVNNSNRVIVHVYLSHVDADDWSGNQLGDSTISPGQSFNLSNLACDQQQVKVIGEDQDGCFSSTVASCGDSVTWTLNNETARDCGGN
jgi:hypothetical protein